MKRKIAAMAIPEWSLSAPPPQDKDNDMTQGERNRPTGDVPKSPAGRVFARAMTLPVSFLILTPNTERTTR